MKIIISILIMLCVLVMLFIRYNDYLLVFLVGSIVLFLTCWLNNENIHVMENMTSQESIENIASIVNSEKAVLKNVDINGVLTIQGWTISPTQSGDLRIQKTGQTKYIDLISTGTDSIQITGDTKLNGNLKVNGKQNISGTIGGSTDSDNVNMLNMVASRVGVNNDIYGSSGQLNISNDLKVNGDTYLMKRADITDDVYTHHRLYFHAPNHYMNTDVNLPHTNFTRWVTRDV